MATWHTPESARLEWKDAPAGPALQSLLAAAQEQCIAYAPAIRNDDAGAPIIPARYPMAQLLQAKALWVASQALAPGDSLGGDGMTVRVYPMDWQVKALLRPTTPRLGLG